MTANQRQALMDHVSDHLDYCMEGWIESGADWELVLMMLEGACRRASKWKHEHREMPASTPRDDDGQGLTVADLLKALLAISESTPVYRYADETILRVKAADIRYVGSLNGEGVILD